MDFKLVRPAGLKPAGTKGPDKRRQRRASPPGAQGRALCSGPRAEPDRECLTATARAILIQRTLRIFVV